MGIRVVVLSGRPVGVTKGEQFIRSFLVQYAFFEGLFVGFSPFRIRIFPPDELGHRDDPPG